VHREVVASEKVPGGFAAIYPVLRAMEEAGKIRRGYFIAGRGVSQFAERGALERLRSMRDLPEEVAIQRLAATDPANAYGAALSWPQRQDPYQPGRVAGAQVILVNGELAAYLSKGEHLLYTFGEDALTLNSVAKALADMVQSKQRRALFLTEIDGKPPDESPLAPALLREGFVRYARGWQKRPHDATLSLERRKKKPQINTDKHR
jgi:ATP-dependent Lhr-like helicase